MNLFDKKQAWILGGFEYLHADNVTADAGAGGATFRSDDIGGEVQVPYAKLMDGTDGSSAVIPGDATNGLYVNVKASVLPSGAATAAKQPALGTAGSASADVITIQGVASMTAVKVDGSSAVQPVNDNGGSLSVDDGGASLTVDYATTGSGTATGALRVELPTNGTGVIATVGAVTAITNALPAGSNAIGKLAANSGVDIGDVDVTSVVPGTGATNLGKAKAGTVGATDTGVGALARLRYSPAHSSGADGTYDTFDLTAWHELRTRSQLALDIQNCNDYTQFTTLGNDTLNLANSANHIYGTAAITFDKVNGAANTVYAGVQDTITALNIQETFEDGGFVALSAYLPSLTNVVGIFLRLGTDSSNYNYWQWDLADFTAARWMALRSPTNQPRGYAGNGWDTSTITYVAFGVEFSNETNTLAGIVFDNVHFVSGQVTDTSLNATIASSVTTPNININRVGGTSTDVSAGNKSAGTLRVTLATDDTNAAAIAASLSVMDDWDESDRAKVNPIVGQAGVAAGAGAVGATVQRVTLASDDPAVTALQIIDDVILAEDAAHVSGDKGVMALAVRKDSAAAIAGTDGDYTPLQVDANGALRVTGAGGGTQYSEDAAHASGDTGTMALVVRRDANTSLVGTDGDYAPLQVDATGSLKVAIISGAGSGGTSATDDAAFSVASGSGTPIMGLADETSPDAVDEGDVGVVRMTLQRALHVNLRDSSGNELSAGAQYAEDAAHTTGDLGTMMLTVRKDTAAATAGTDGDYQPPTTDASGRMHVNVGAMPNVTLAAGTNTNEVVGDAAHDAAVAGNPVRAAGRARTSDYTSVANDDTADFITDLNGKQIVLPYSIPENFVSGAITTAMTGTTSTSLVAAPAAGLRNYLTTIIVSNAHATVGTDVIIQDGNGGTTLMTIPAAAVYGGATITLPVPLRQPTTATAIYCANVTTGASTKVSAVGYKAP